MVAALAGCSAGDTSGDTQNGSGGGGSVGGPPANSEPIEPADGWVAGDTNESGIQGALYTFKDDSGESTINPDDFAASGTTVCVDGTGAQVDLECDEDDCYGYFWGAGVGLNLNQEVDSDETLGYNADASGVVGFYFEITGPTIPQGLRFKAVGVGDEADYCVNITAGERSVLFSELRKSCWQPVAGEVDTTNLQAVQWQVSTATAGARPFNFCIENIRAIRAE